LSDARIGAMLSDLAQTPLGIRAEQDFRISVAGAQEKTALLFHEGQWVPEGLVASVRLGCEQRVMRMMRAAEQ
jgi:serine/threonine-protein kinase HipA